LIEGPDAIPDVIDRCADVTDGVVRFRNLKLANRIVDKRPVPACHIDERHLGPGGDARQ
jgi:hypothetical protein